MLGLPQNYMPTDTQAIKDRIDIVQLIGEYITLKKAGVNWKANCPFHHEKSPSFMVHQEKQIWHCFGCSKGGDIFSFVQEIEGLDFIEALKLLANRAGVRIETHTSEVNQSQRNRILEINSAAAYFFHHFFLEIPGAEVARKYLEDRKLTKQTIEEWQVGYVPDQWDLLTRYLLKKGFGINDLIAAGLTIKRDGADEATGRGFYDRFRGRVMFPLSDAHGNIVGFTGRVLVETEHSGGKYVNTPETIVYDKSRVLYGLHKAKTEIKAKDLSVVVEGQMDVVACHQAGMRNVVAASGTALTPEQVKLLKRYSNNVAMAFDADAAGQSAGKRGAGIAMEEGMNVKVIQLPKGFAKDADECIKKDPKVWFAAVGSATGVLEWYFERILSSVNRSSPTEKQQAVAILLPEIARVPFGVVRDEWLKRLGEALLIDPGVLRDEVKRAKKAPLRSPQTQVTSIKAPPAVLVRESQYDILVKDFWSFLVKFPDSFAALYPELKPVYFVNTAWHGLYEIAEKVYNNEQKLDLASVRQILAEKGREQTLDLLLLMPMKNTSEFSSLEAGKELASVLSRIKEEWRKQRGKEIQQKIMEAERAKDKATVEALLQELQTL